MKKRVKKKGIIILLMVVPLLSILIIKGIEPINLNDSGIAAVSLRCIGGEARIVNEEQIRDIVSVINSIKAIKGDDDLVEYIGGDTPDAWAHFYDKEGKKKHFINIYGNIILYDDTYYKIVGDEEIQQNKIMELCKKYGRLY